jgi:hypothetical protein
VEAIELGSRSGSLFALVLFGTMFAVLGWVTVRELAARSPGPGGRKGAAAAGLLLFAGPVLLVYVTSLGGFYEATTDGGILRLVYLWPVVHADVPFAQVRQVEAVPAFRFRWRLRVDTTSGDRFQSATSRRSQVEAAAARLRRTLAEAGRMQSIPAGGPQAR